MLPATRAATSDWFGTIMNPFQYNAKKVQDSGNEIAGKCTWIGRPLWRHCITVKLTKLRSRIPSAQRKSDLTNKAVKTTWRALLAVKWPQTAAALCTRDASRLNS